MPKPQKTDAAPEKAAQTLPQQPPAAEPPPSIAQALTALEHGRRAFRAFEDAHAAVAVLANLDQVAREREQAAKAAAELAAAASAELESVQSDLRAARGKANNLIREAEAKAAKAVEDAQAQAKAIETEAQARVDALRAEADALAAQLLEAQQQVQQAIEATAAEQARADEIKAQLRKLVE